MIIKLLKMSAFIILYIGVFFIMEVFIQLLYLIVYLITNPDSLRAFDSKSFEILLYKNSLILSIISAVAIVPIYWFILWLRKKRIVDFCGFSKISKKYIGLTVCIGITLVLPVDFIVSSLSIDKLSPGTEKIFNIIFEGNSLPVLLLGIGIIGPLLEELIFRGLILNEAKKVMPITVAVVIQGLLFGALHMNWTQFLYAAPLGILFGLIYIWTKSIWSTIIVHVVFNSTGIILNQFFNDQALLTGLISSVSFAIVIIMMVLIWLDKNKKSCD